MEDTLTVASRAAEMRDSPGEFGTWLDERHASQKAILETVKDEVSSGNIEPLVGARIASCVAGSIFGYEEFHPRNTVPAEQLLETLRRGVSSRN